MAKNLLAMQETWVRSLGWEDPLEKETAAHSSILAWRIPRIEEPGGLQSMRSQRVRHDCVTNTMQRKTNIILYHFMEIENMTQGTYLRNRKWLTVVENRLAKWEDEEGWTEFEA